MNWLMKPTEPTKPFKFFICLCFHYVVCSLSQRKSMNSGRYVPFHPVVSVVFAGDSPNNLDFRKMRSFWPCSFCSFRLEALNFRYVCDFLYVMCSLSQGESKNSGGYVQFHPVVSVVSAGDSPNNLDFRYMRSFWPCSFCWELSQQFRFF